MRFDRTWMAIRCMMLVCAAAGCSQSPWTPLGVLPVHRLQMSPLPMRAAGRAAWARLAARDPSHPWYAEGYRLWRYIVIHHSASEGGNAAVFDTQHRKRGWDELGYHFVIDSGRGGPDGRIEVGGRWTKQKWGAHCGGTPNNEYNNHGIGICLVGNFTDRLPSEKQLESLRRLVEYLVSTYDIPPENVIGHRDSPNASTECPGRRFWAYLHATLRPAWVRYASRR